MRVTDGMRQASVLRNLQDLSSRHADATQRAQSGMRVNQPSDDPSAAAELVKNRVRQAKNESSQEAVNMARGDLELAEGTLAEAGDLFGRLQEIAISGGNGALGADERKNLATEVGNIKAQLVSLANTRGTKGFLFAGNKVDTTPFSSAGAFSGDDGEQQVDLGSGAPVSVGVSGALAFTAAGGRNVFADLDALQTALAANDSGGATATLTGLEASRKQVMAVRSDSGLKISRLDTTEDVLSLGKVAIAKRNEDVGGADPYAAYSDLVNLQSALEQAVAVSRKVLDLGSLFRQ